MIIKRSLQFLAPVVLVAALAASGSDSKSSATTATTVASPTTTSTTAGPTTAGPTTTSAGGTGTTVDTSTAVSTGDSTGGAGAATPFCQFEDDLNTAFNDVNPESVDQLVAVFKKFDSKMDGWVASAPADLKADAQTLVDAARKTVSSGDPSAFLGEGVQTAGTAIDSYCGLN